MEVLGESLKEKLKVSNYETPKVTPEVLQETEKGSAFSLDLNELRRFESHYPVVVQALVDLNKEHLPDMEYATEWMLKVVNYNVRGGKKLRGLMVPILFKTLVREPSEDDLRLSYVLGWIIEFLQSASLIADDIMDGSETRRGKPCWYRREDVGMIAINDVLLLESFSQHLLSVFARDLCLRDKLWNTTRLIITQTIYGQTLDFQTGRSGNIKDDFTMERYNMIVKYKTSYYTIYLPVALAVILAGKGEDKDLMKQLEKIALEIGHFFQVQDDFLDCFGDPKVSGKIGTDIQDCKCSWLFVKAKEMCSPEQLKILLGNYGQQDPVQVGRVKELYRELGLEQCFREFEKEAKGKIEKMIGLLPETLSGGGGVLLELLNVISGRRR